MSDKQQQMATVNELVGKFLQLANDLKNEGKPVEAINGAMMLACCTYSTYFHAGNEGYLNEEGIKKMSELFQHNLTTYQKMKKQELEKAKQ